jgi:tRNA A37 N6-isopentenylltransferase MiaA
MRLSARFLAQMRQYSALEEQLNRDYSPMLQVIGWNEVLRLQDAGMSEQDAIDAVNQAFTHNVKRFPLQLEINPA